MAINLARRCDYSCFPCDAGGMPAMPNGVRAASKIPLTLIDVWRRWPGELVGIATGCASAIWVLSIRPEGVNWWRENNKHLLPTRAFENRGGGVDLYFTDGGEIPSTTGRIHSGVDTHSDDSFVIHWFAAGLACRDHSPPAPWPAWLCDALRSAA
jgi:hypothetical protein